MSTKLTNILSFVCPSFDLPDKLKSLYYRISKRFKRTSNRYRLSNKHVESFVDLAEKLICVLFFYPSGFPSRKRQEFRELTSDILFKARISPNVFFLALFYLNRFKQLKPLRCVPYANVDSFRQGVLARNYFLAALAIAEKVLNDSPPKNIEWAKLAKVTVWEVSRRERELLEIFKYELAVSPGRLIEFTNILREARDPFRSHILSKLRPKMTVLTKTTS
ncbi:PHO85 cyclin-5 [Basidiobolus ranarum]|uniref:PHO85 cyclin-5 n=1 Tax=Basidiobolus ranarum TaxID=34480 RepID=A0ABR2VY25_9FUNG